jgi:hypothetical protein
LLAPQRGLIATVEKRKQLQQREAMQGASAKQKQQREVYSRNSQSSTAVPEIAPTAKRMVVPFAQRFASKRWTGSPVDLHRHSEIVIIKGNETPIVAKMMWNAKDIPIWDRVAMKLSIYYSPGSQAT